MFNRLLEWVYAPLNKIGFPVTDGPNYDIIEFKTGMPGFTGPKVCLYRPKVFGEYIGQSKAKGILKAYISATKERGGTMPHVLLHGRAGCGKTTLAQIIARESNVQYKEMVTSSIGNTWDVLSAINQVDGGVLFLDEIHSIDRTIAESIYSIMEDFKYNGQPIKPFTLIGATTELGELYKTRRPFVDRFKVPIELADYTIPELAILVRQYRNITFPSDVIDLGIYDIVAANCRRTPRVGIRLLESCVYLHGNIQQVLNNFDILAEGYTNKDLEILRYLASAPINSKGIRTGVGVLGICSYLGTSTENYCQVMEPWLLRNNLIVRSGQGRKLTLAGELKILELEKVAKT